jgi:hypothetical protein
MALMMTQPGLVVSGDHRCTRRSGLIRPNCPRTRILQLIARSPPRPSDLHAKSKKDEIVSKASFVPLAEEIDEEETHIEGPSTTVQINQYERDGKAREKCIKLHGYGGLCRVQEAFMDRTFRRLKSSTSRPVHHVCYIRKPWRRIHSFQTWELR